MYDFSEKFNLILWKTALVKWINKYNSSKTSIKYDLRYLRMSFIKEKCRKIKLSIHPSIIGTI